MRGVRQGVDRARSDGGVGPAWADLPTGISFGWWHDAGLTFF